MNNIPTEEESFISIVNIILSGTAKKVDRKFVDDLCTKDKNGKLDTQGRFVKKYIKSLGINALLIDIQRTYIKYIRNQDILNINNSSNTLIFSKFNFNMANRVIKKRREIKPKSPKPNEIGIFAKVSIDYLGNVTSTVSGVKDSYFYKEDDFPKINF